MAITVIRCLAALLLLLAMGRAVHAQQPPSSTYVPPSVSPPSLTATGTNQATALALAKNVNQVTGAAGTCPVGGPYTSCNGVVLPSAWNQGDFMEICSLGTANGFLVYADGTGALVGGGAASGTAVRVEVNSCNLFRKLSIGANGKWSVS